jgi:hypothetical protein
MAYSGKLVNKPGETITKKPAAALAAANRFVTQDTDEFSVVLSSGGDNPIGVTPVAAAAAETIEVVKHGTPLVELGATDIAIGDYVMPGTAGVALKSTGTAFVGGRCVAFVGTLAVGDLISVDLDDKYSKL